MSLGVMLSSTLPLTEDRMINDDTGPGDTVLDEVPTRALTFLRGIAQSPIIYALLAGGGFTSDEYQLGWKLLHAASGYKLPSEAPPTPPPTPSLSAIKELDAWDEDGFRRIRSALDRLHPAQAAFVFRDGLAASVGPAAVLGVHTLLDRLDELESGKDRDATRKEDQAALATLAKRGITKDERSRLRGLVDTAENVGAPAALPAAPEPEERRKTLLALYTWYKDWSNTAHSVLRKRAHLITLGLAKRKPPKKHPPTTPHV